MTQTVLGVDCYKRNAKCLLIMPAASSLETERKFLLIKIWNRWIIFEFIEALEFPNNSRIMQWLNYRLN